MNRASDKKITAAVIAGGQSRRMAGREKCLLPLGDGTVLEALVKRLSHQAERIVVNSNRDPALYRRFDLPIVADAVSQYCGPLAGVVSVMEWLRSRGQDGWLLTVPSDTPFIPLDLAGRLHEGVQDGNAEIAYACSGQPHFLTALWPLDMVARLNAFVASGGCAVRDFFATCRVAEVWFADDNIDPFFNINTPEDYLLAQHNSDKLI